MHGFYWYVPRVGWWKRANPHSDDAQSNLPVRCTVRHLQNTLGVYGAKTIKILFEEGKLTGSALVGFDGSDLPPNLLLEQLRVLTVLDKSFDVEAVSGTRLRQLKETE